MIDPTVVATAHAAPPPQAEPEPQLLGREDGPSPYAAARAAYQRQTAELQQARARWQQIATALAAVCALLAGANTRLALRSEIVPYVVEVDRHGQLLAFGPAEPLVRPERRLLVSEIGRFVRSLRSVHADPVAQQERIAEAYAYAGDDARSFLDAHLAAPENNPLLLGQAMTRVVEVTSVLPVPGGDSWKVRWTETELPIGGERPAVSAWEAYLEVQLRPSRDAEVFQSNPLGLYVVSIHWTRLSEPAAPARWTGGATAGRPAGEPPPLHASPVP